MSQCFGRKSSGAIDDIEMAKLCHKDVTNKPFTWHPTVSNVQQIVYVQKLQQQLQNMQTTCFYLRTELARFQFRVRQIISGSCSRRQMVAALDHIIVNTNPLEQCHPELLPTLSSYNTCMGDIKKKQMSLILDLRNQIGKFPSPKYEFLYTTDCDKEMPVVTERLCTEVEVPKTSKSCISFCKSTTKSSATRNLGGAEAKNTIYQEDLQNNQLNDNEDCEKVDTDIETNKLPSERSIPFKKLCSLYQRKCSRVSVNN